jgi:hypothetical protein
VPTRRAENKNGKTKTEKNFCPRKNPKNSQTAEGDYAAKLASAKT